MVCKLRSSSYSHSVLTFLLGPFTMSSARLSSRSSVGFSRTVYALFVAVVVMTLVKTSVQENAIANMIQGEETKMEAPLSSIMWGLLDTSVSAGTVFQYRLSNEAMGGETSTYEVREHGLGKLPCWLDYEGHTNTLVGIPGSDDIGKSYYIEVTGVSKYNNSRVTDIFSIRVVDFSAHSYAFAPAADQDDENPIKCNPGSSVTTATIIIDADLGNLQPLDKISVVRGLCEHLGLPLTAVRLLSPGSQPLFDSSALVAGPGDVIQPAHSGALLQWEVGCGNVQNKHLSMLQTVEVTARNGTMSTFTGHKIVGWHVTNKKPVAATRRLKRQVPRIAITATPTMVAKPPSAKPVPTSVIKEVKQTDSPPTRVVPTKVSPVLPIVIPTDDLVTSRTKTTKYRKQKTTATKRPPKHPKSTKPMMELEPSVTVPETSSYMATKPTPVLVLTDAGVLPSLDSETVSTTGKSKIIENVTVPLKIKSGPQLMKEIPPFSVVIGEIFEYRIPDDLFKDPVEGNTKHLSLKFTSEDRLEMMPGSWIKLNASSNTLFGMPLHDHKGQGEQVYLLEAKNTKDETARAKIVIKVIDRPYEQKVNVEMGAALDLDYQTFISDVDLRLDVANKIASAFGDPDSSNMLVTKIAEGSVEYSWTNKSISSEDCPSDEVLEMMNKFVLENGSVDNSFLEAIKPYRILRANAVPMGECTETIKPRNATRIRYVITGRPTLKQHKTTTPELSRPIESKPAESDGILVRAIVPSLIIAALVILAIIIACCLCRRRRRAKAKQLEADSNGPVKKGAPVIFANELEDKPEPPTKPLVMDSERAPRPPDYQQATGSNSPSTPRSEYREHLISKNQPDQRSSGQHQPYRKPPPYNSQ